MERSPIRWGVGYAIFMPRDPRCGFILNPDADKIYKISFCNERAIYGFRFKNEDPRSFGAALGAWHGVCPEHAAVIREQDRIATMWTLKTDGVGA